jgi:hypothetical protein
LPAAGLDTDRPHPARMWNYWLGGKDNFRVDREVGDQIIAAYPSVREVARASRACLGRMVRYLAAEEGIRQFLDIGTGLPTADNTHEVAQRAAPDSTIVYVDNDPLVLAHAMALIMGNGRPGAGGTGCRVHVALAGGSHRARHPARGGCDLRAGAETLNPAAADR